MIRNGLRIPKYLLSGAVACIGSLLMGPHKASADTDFPPIKYGSWEMTTQVPNFPNPIKVTHCFTEENRNKLIEMSQNTHAHCAKPKISHSKNVWTTTTECEFRGKPSTLTSVLTFDGETHFTSKVTSDNPDQQFSLSSEGRYLGECSNKSAQLELAPGIKLDPKQLENIAKSVVSAKQKP